MNSESSHASFKLVGLPNGIQVVYSSAYDEKMHPGLGPAAEAELLYVRQLKISERMHAGDEEFVVWDIGLGAAANAIAVLRATREISRPLRLISFDNTAEPLEFALQKAEALGYLGEYKQHTRSLFDSRRIEFQNGNSAVTWEFILGDFPNLLAGSSRGHEAQTQFSAAETKLKPHVGCYEFASPHAILFDAFSPAKNPAMWTLPVFTNLHRALDPERACNLTTYSRSTMFRVTLLLAGFFVGRGVASGVKEETTVAANTLELIDAPLDCRWLERARRSDSAEPMQEPVYSQSPLSAQSWERLQSHSQFRQ